MISAAVWRIAKKDGLEVLRDRRTLFVNLVLPVLLYPLVTLFLIQVMQVAQATKRDPPRLAAIGVPAPILRQLTAPAEPPATGRKAAAAANASAPAEPATPASELPQLPPEVLSRFSELAGRLDRPTPAPADRSAALALLREHRLVLALVVLPSGADDTGPVRVVRLQDDAHQRLDDAAAAVDHALEAWRDEKVAATLATAGLAPSVLKPVSSRAIGLAPPAEAVRTRIAGMIPLLLVILAASGAFFPAMDLIAGERERGTLETLLSLPVRRRDVFVGKLLVCCGAALAAVILNLLSLVLTAGVMGAQLAKAGAGAGIDIGSMLGVGGGTLLLCVAVLLPLTITMAAVALALGGLASSVKEANNYLAPLILVITVAAGVAAMPRVQPNLALDLIPITGVVLALKEALQSPHLPWLHLALAGLSSLVVAAVVVTWASRLLESERFRYPSLVRAGWGRWRRWGLGPAKPGGLEVLGVYAIAVAGMTMGAGFLSGTHAAALVLVPLVGFVALPALAHAWAGAYTPAAIHLGTPAPRHLLAGILLILPAIALSAVVGKVQEQLVDPKLLEQGGAGVMEVIAQLQASGGLALVLLCVAVAPGICEETLCRGTLLAGLRQGLGTTGGVLVSGFLFAVLHLSPWRFAPQCALGIALALLCLRCGSIWPGVIVHAGHNALLVVAELGFSGALPALQPVADWLRRLPPSVLWAASPMLVLALGAAGWRLAKR